MPTCSGVKYSKPSEAAGDPGLLREVVAGESGPEQALVEANQRAMVHAMIDGLPEELRRQ